MNKTLQQERSSSFQLSDEQREAFFRDGFIGPLPRFAPIELLDRVAARLMQIENDKAVHPLYGRYSPRDWHLVDDDLQELLTHRGMVEPAKQVMGENLLLWRSKAFIKPPFGGELGWHQEWGPFDGAEIGNDVPALQPAGPLDAPWNISIWFALDDIDANMGPIRFIPGSHTNHYPVEQVPIPDSAFFEDPFVELSEPMEIVARARSSTLLLDIDTSKYFDGVEVSRLAFEDAKEIVIKQLSKLTGEVMHPVGVDLDDHVEMPMQKGEFVIFYERTLHGSAASRSERFRPAVNCRVTPSSTLVYPQRLKGQFIDGSNVDIRRHYCIPLCGTQRHPDNVYADAYAEAS